ncbi:MAG TPA: putative lipid II flippase FtsW [Actinomycetota bacterium]|nr:putative lipid II flippase FtsW [Actinomycetota bacterium]
MRTAPRLAESSPAQTSTERLDLTVMVCASALTIIGLVMTLSASSVRSAASTGSAFTLFGRQFLWAGLGFVALVCMSRIDYRRLRGIGYLAMPAVWVLLVMTLIPGVGMKAGGATRWLPLGPIAFQPSEAAKLVLILFGADVLSRKLSMLDDWRHVALPFFASAGVTCLLVLMQPDFGTAVITACSAMLLAFLAGAPLRFLGSVTAAGVVVGIPIMLAEPYRRARLFGFANASTDSLNTGWQSVQGMVALGSGGLTGMGLGSSRQKYGYLPNGHTDFIFAIIGEETGLAGTLTVLFLFGLLAVTAIKVARRSVDAFGFLLSSAVIGWISIQVLVNIGAVTGVLPITGVPLPLVSFGGSSLVFSLAGLGIVASVARHGTAGGPRPPR